MILKNLIPKNLILWTECLAIAQDFQWCLILVLQMAETADLLFEVLDLYLSRLLLVVDFLLQFLYFGSEELYLFRSVQLPIRQLDLE